MPRVRMLKSSKKMFTTVFYFSIPPHILIYFYSSKTFFTALYITAAIQVKTNNLNVIFQIPSRIEEIRFCDEA